MIPTARVQRGPSEAARCASTGIIPATPLPFSASCIKRPALVWNTETAIRTGRRSAILQSLKADCSVHPSSYKPPLRGPCLAAPAIDSASLEPSPRHRNRSGALCTLAAQGRVKPELGYCPLSALPTSFSYKLTSILSESTRARCLTKLQAVALRDLTRLWGPN